MKRNYKKVMPADIEKISINNLIKKDFE